MGTKKDLPPMNVPDDRTRNSAYNQEPPPSTASLAQSLATTRTSESSTSTQSKQRAARRALKTKKTSSFNDQENDNRSLLDNAPEDFESVPGAVAVQGNDAFSFHESQSIPDEASHKDEEDPSSMIVAAELVVHRDEEAPDMAPSNELWEKKVKEEVQTQLFMMTQQANMAVAEAIVVDRSGVQDVNNGVRRESTEGKKMNTGCGLTWSRICLLLLFALIVAGAVAAGVVAGTKKQSNDSQLQASASTNIQKSTGAPVPLTLQTTAPTLSPQTTEPTLITQISNPTEPTTEPTQPPQTTESPQTNELTQSPQTNEPTAPPQTTASQEPLPTVVVTANQEKLWQILKPSVLRTNSSAEDFKPFQDSSSPQSLALHWLFNDTITISENASTQTILDRYALAVLYYSTNGPNWNNDFVFLTADDVCTWNNHSMASDQFEYALGVLCESTSVAYQTIQLREVGLDGTLPWELSLLANAVVLRMNQDALRGTLPSELSRLSDLVVLDFSFNDLSGSIPTGFGKLSKLGELSLENNTLTGTLPTELGDITYLSLLNVQFNKLLGTIPTQLAGSPLLSALYLNSNLLSGTIPTQFGQLKNLVELYLHTNSLTGTVPTEIGAMMSLEWLDLYENQLIGTLPTEFGQLTTLYEIDISDNLLTGTIPTVLGQCNSLDRLYLYENQFTGTLPTELGNLTRMTELKVYENKFIGKLPTELGLLTMLEALEVARNRLTGTLPTELSRLTALSWIDVSDNSFTGTIPQGLADVMDDYSLQSPNNFATRRSLSLVDTNHPWIFKVLKGIYSNEEFILHKST